jgi:Holliday junction DNA helicase RuvB
MEALNLAEVDHAGLDKQDRRYLETLTGVFQGGPAGVEAIAATMNLPSDTLSDEVEPYLLREQYVLRTARGRIATGKAWTHLGKIQPHGQNPDSLPDLFHQAGL